MGESTILIFCGLAYELSGGSVHIGGMKAQNSVRTKTSKAGSAARALPRGPVASYGSGGGDERPKLLDAMTEVMGHEWLPREEIFARLSERGWAPGASQPLSYLVFTMEENSELFTRSGAKFRVRPSVARKATASPVEATLPATGAALSTVRPLNDLKQPRPAPARESPRDAEHWRSMLASVLRAADAPAALHQELVRGLEARTWVNLTDGLGNKFLTFEAFCGAPSPFGLGTEAGHVRRVLERLVGPRRTDLLTHDPSRQGARNQLPANVGGKSTRQTERLRAVHERAPEPVRRLYTAGILSLAAAAGFGVANPTTAQAAEIQQASDLASELMQSLGEQPSESEVRAARSKARALLSERTSRGGAAILLMNRVRALSASEREAFTRLFKAWLSASEANRA